MILNISGRTDVVQFYTDWLLKRFSEGYVLSRNPLFPNKVTRYELSPDTVDCVVFSSKNYTPILPHIRKIADRFNTYFYYTITAYGKDLEPGVPSVSESIETLIRLSEIVGRERVAWRYDPVLLTESYTVETHLHAFEETAKRLYPHIDRCIFNFVEMYKKVRANMPQMIPLTDADKDMLARGFGRVAEKLSMPVQTCGLCGDFTRFGIQASGCMTLEILGNANHIRFRDMKHKGKRAGCGCIETRDAGAYDTCMNGCKYCYANINPQKAFENYKLHDPDSPLLLGNLKPTDAVQAGNQKSFLAGGSVRRGKNNLSGY